MSLKVLMLPQLKEFSGDESGIKRVIEAYHRYAGEFDIQYVDNNENCDLTVSHAGTFPGADVAINHGLYWTADYSSDGWEWQMNAQVIKTLRMAKEITVPSTWVAETFKRDMRLSPHVVGHGIEWEDWQVKTDKLSFILWNKNRASDVCDPTPVAVLAKKFPSLKFLTTFFPKTEETFKNVRVTGMLSHTDMKKIILSSGIYLATTKETFGIGVLEAMASGLPILGFAYGGNLDLVKHGVNGYLAVPNNYEDLANGLEYCIKNIRVLGNNSREISRQFTWQQACHKIRQVYDLALQKKYHLPLVIPESEYKQ